MLRPPPCWYWRQTRTIPKNTSATTISSSRNARVKEADGLGHRLGALVALHRAFGGALQPLTSQPGPADLRLHRMGGIERQQVLHRRGRAEPARRDASS